MKLLSMRSWRRFSMTTKRISHLLCVCACVGLTTNFTMESLNAQQPMPDENRETDPSGGGNEIAPIFLPGIDAPAERPNHPPLDEIPWLEVPDPVDVPLHHKSNSTMVHDAETGETTILPAGESSGLDFSQSIEGDYPGAFNRVIPEPVVGRAFGNMFAAGSLDSWPRSGNVKLVLHWVDNNGNDVWSQCSGTMQDSGVVLAAAHCVFNRNANINDWCTEVYIYPAWDGVGTLGGPAGTDELIENFGYVRSTFYLAGSGYVNAGDFDRDVAVLRIRRGSSRQIGMLTGWFGWAWGGSCNTTRTYNNFSYPAENCHNGRTMYFWSGTYDGCPGNQLELDSTGGNCLDTVWGGMSGSGTYYIDDDNRFVHAVCSTSNRNDIGRYCKLWEGFVTAMQDFETDTRGTTFDLEALRCRALGTTTIEAGEAMDDQMQVYVANATNADPASDTYTVRVYLSTNNNISEFDTLLATWNYNVDFAAMQGRTFNIPAPVIPASTPPGTYWIGVEIDQATDTVSANNDTDTWDAQQVVITNAPPSNDAWAGTIQVAGPYPAFASGENYQATEQADEQHLDPAGSTVWWWVQAPNNGTMTINTFGSNFDTMLHIYDGFSDGFANLNLVAFNDDADGGTQSEVSFPVIAGEFYEVRVAGYNSAQGEIELAVDFEEAGIVDVTPATVVVTEGNLNSGGAPELQTNDGNDLSIFRSPTSISAVTEFEVTAASPTAAPTLFEVNLEGSVFARLAVAQSIALYNFDTNTFEVVSTTPASRFVDNSVSASPGGDLSRFVGPGNEIRARVRFTGSSPRLSFTSNTDQFFWTIQ